MKPTLPSSEQIARELQFQRALSRARARGGPRADLDALTCRPSAPPAIFGERLSRMTLGIERLLQKRAGMPGEISADEIVLFFLRGPAVAQIMASYDEEAQAWAGDECRHAYETVLAEVARCAEALGELAGAEVAAWLNRELNEWHRLSSGGDDKDRRSSAGSEGSRVGWWLRCVEEILHRHGARCPDKADPVTWAVWQFPVCDHLALLPAALEREGVEQPAHYALSEARRARRVEAAQPARETPVPDTVNPKSIPTGPDARHVCGVTCQPGDANCNGYCSNQASLPALISPAGPTVEIVEIGQP